LIIAWKFLCLLIVFCACKQHAFVFLFVMETDVVAL
jgi:hypothetical protein